MRLLRLNIRTVATVSATGWLSLCIVLASCGGADEATPASVAQVQNTAAAVAKRPHERHAGLHLVAGTVGGGGYLNGNGDAARFLSPSDVAADAAGNIYVTDTFNAVIRKITAAGDVTTLAGSHTVGGFADGTGSAAQFGSVEGIAADAVGNVYVTDTTWQTVRKITPAGVVTTLAGAPGVPGSADGRSGAARFNSPLGIAVDRAGNLYVADTQNHAIRKIAPSGLVTTLAGAPRARGCADGTGAAARFNAPVGIAIDESGTLYVADGANQTIRKITAAGAVTTLAGSVGVSGSADGDGPAARFSGPKGIVVDGAGDLYVTDRGNGTVRKITAGGTVTTIAGTAGSAGPADGLGAAARFNFPSGVTLDNSGNLYVADRANQAIRKITLSREVTTFAGAPNLIGDADGIGAAARFSTPISIAADRRGNAYVADQGNQTIRKISTSGVVTTLAGSPGLIGSADGNGSAARFYNPAAVAVDRSSNVYVADSYNHTIRKITAAGRVTTLAGTAGASGAADGNGPAARFSGPGGIVVDDAGNIYVTEYLNNTIRKITPAGVVTTIAGVAGSYGRADGPGTAARFDVPYGIDVDRRGNLYVADSGSRTIRKITPSGVVSTLAGSFGGNGSADGRGSAAQFDMMYGIALDREGNLFVADTGNSAIRKVTPDGMVTTVAGVSHENGIRLGDLPGHLDMPLGVTLIGRHNTLAITSGTSVLKLVLP